MVGIVFLWLALVDSSPLLNQVIKDIRKGLRQKHTTCAMSKAKGLIGTREVGANNRGPRVDSIIRYAGGVPGQAWCSYALIYIWKRCGISREGLNGMAMSWAKKDRAVIKERLTETDVFTVYNKHLGRVGHVGMVYKIYPEESFFQSFEGNINARGDRESKRSKAGCLMREYSVANGFYRWMR